MSVTSYALNKMGLKKKLKFTSKSMSLSEFILELRHLGYNELQSQFQGTFVTLVLRHKYPTSSTILKLIIKEESILG